MILNAYLDTIEGLDESTKDAIKNGIKRNAAQQKSQELSTAITEILAGEG